jgi:hypothetical protein
MTVAYVQSQASGRASGAAFTPTMPAGVTVGNLLVCVCHTYNTGAPTVTTPSGWTLLVNGTVVFGPSNGRRHYVFIKKAVASEPAPVLTPSANAYFVVLIAEYSGQDPTTPTDGTASPGTADADNSVNTPAITTASANSLVVYTYAGDTGDGTTTRPAGTTQRYNGEPANAQRIVLSDKLQAAAGTVAATSHTRTGASQSSLAATMAIRDASAAASTFVPQITIT